MTLQDNPGFFPPEKEASGWCVFNSLDAEQVTTLSTVLVERGFATQFYKMPCGHWAVAFCAERGMVGVVFADAKDRWPKVWEGFKL